MNVEEGNRKRLGGRRTGEDVDVGEKEKSRRGGEGEKGGQGGERGKGL